MSDQDNRNDGSLVPTGRGDLAPVAPTNPLVSRGLVDLAKTQMENLLPSGSRTTAPSDSDYAALLTRARLKQARLMAFRDSLPAAEGALPSGSAHRLDELRQRLMKFGDPDMPGLPRPPGQLDDGDYGQQ